MITRNRSDDIREKLKKVFFSHCSAHREADISLSSVIFRIKIILRLDKVLTQLKEIKVFRKVGWEYYAP